MEVIGSNPIAPTKFPDQLTSKRSLATSRFACRAEAPARRLRFECYSARQLAVAPALILAVLSGIGHSSTIPFNVARPKKTKVFVSYSRHDEALVKPLAGLLGVAADDAVFLDVASLKPGDLWDEKIIGAVKEASVFVLCWCCQCEHSTFIAKEISAALLEKKKKLVPVLFCSTPLPPAMADRQWIDLRGQIVHDCLSPQTQDKEVPRDPSDKKIARVRPPAQWDAEKIPASPPPPPPQRLRMDQTPPPAPAMSRPSGIPAAYKSRTSRVLYTLLVILLAAGLGIYVFFTHAAKPESPIHPVQTSYLPLIILAMVALVFLSCVAFLLKKALRFIRERHERKQAEEIAATASSYFENLGKT